MVQWVDGWISEWVGEVGSVGWVRVWVGYGCGLVSIIQARWRSSGRTIGCYGHIHVALRTAAVSGFECSRPRQARCRLRAITHTYHEQHNVGNNSRRVPPVPAAPVPGIARKTNCFIAPGKKVPRR